MKKTKGNLVPMLADKEYQKIAKKILYNKLKNNLPLAENIFNDNSKFGLVVEAVMCADWEWDGRGTIYGYRKQRAKWAIYKIIKQLHIDNETTPQLWDDHSYTDFYDKKQKDFVKEIEQKDYIDYVENKIQESALLSEKEKQVLIGKFLNDKTIVEISEELNVRGEAIRQTLKRAMIKIGKSLCV